MGRKLRRVPLDFDWPLNKVWAGFCNPFHKPTECEACDQTGYNPETKKIADEWYDSDGCGIYSPLDDSILSEAVNDPKKMENIESAILFWVKSHGVRWAYLYGINPEGQLSDRHPWKIVGDCRSWCHSITQDEVQALVAAERLYDFTHTWIQGTGWVKNDPPTIPTADQVNNWSLRGMGHDGINRGICIEQRAKRLGVYGLCEKCGGEGVIWESNALKALAERYENIEPPTGDGYQLWETVSEGSPITPVFATPEELARWLVEHDDSITRDTSFDQWLQFINKHGHAISMVIDGDGLKSGVQAVAELSQH